MRTNRETVVGLAWFRPDQWQRLRDISADCDLLELTHSGWERIATRTLKRLRRSGVNVKKVAIDVEELFRWCTETNRPVNGEARAEFASLKLE